MENVKVKNISSTSYQVIGLRLLNLIDKLKLLGISGSVIISILTGLIIESTDSLITILRTHRKPEIQLFRLYIRTEAKCMTMAQEEKIRINYPEVPTTKYDDRATHVVTEIEYGVDFTFTFSKQEDEGIKDETFSLTLLIHDLTFKLLVRDSPRIHWESNILTCLDFEWSKVGWLWDSLVSHGLFHI